MTLSTTWHPDAASEFDGGVEWYDDREAGLGDRFEVGVLDAVAQCVAAPSPTRPLGLARMLREHRGELVGQIGRTLRHLTSVP